jgi:hypothetical protein
MATARSLERCAMTLSLLLLAAVQLSLRASAQEIGCGCTLSDIRICSTWTEQQPLCQNAYFTIIGDAPVLAEIATVR